MFELKMQFDSECELLDFTRRLERETAFSVACVEFDNDLRSMVKYGQHDDLIKRIEQETQMVNVSEIDAIDMCRILFNRALESHGISLYE